MVLTPPYPSSIFFLAGIFLYKGVYFLLTHSQYIDSCNYLNFLSRFKKLPYTNNKKITREETNNNQTGGPYFEAYSLSNYSVT